MNFALITLLLDGTLCVYKHVHVCVQSVGVVLPDESE